MSVKRQATTELNHENWDKEDPEEEEEVGTFKTASKEILQKRVIITAKRRTQGTSDEAKKSVFSGFGGFNKTQPSSFDFLSKLTNGNKNTNNENTAKNDTSVSSSLFSSKPALSSQAGIFGSTTTSPVKTSLGSITTPATGNLFSTTAGNTVASSSVFPSIKADSTVSDSPFKIQPATSTVETTTVPKFSNTNSTTSTTPQITSNIFGVSSTSGTPTIPGKSLFATTNNTSSLFKTQPTSSPAVSNKNANSNTAEKKTDDKSNDKTITYYTKLKGLNESVLDWIKKHVDETPLCILSPIFKDYDKYLKEIQDEFESPAKENSNKELVDDSKSQSVKPTLGESTKPASISVSSGSVVPKMDPLVSKASIFGTQNTNTSEKSTGFSFGSNTTSSLNTSTASTGFTFASNTTTSATATTTSGGFKFGSNSPSNTPATTTTSGFTFGITSTSASTTTTSSPFSFTPNKTASSNGSAPFSFGTGKPFSFSSNVTQKVENTNTNNGNDAQEDEDTPPKVEYTPIAEENSVFEKRCKIFHKKDANFVDMGVGTLYIKKIDDSDKHQLLVRAHTTLGNVLLNVRLSSAVPTQRMGKNNVMLVCIPTPTFKPPPIPVLIRVKTSEEADELLETLNKYKS